MAQALPLILASLAGFALVLVLTSLWQSMRVVLQGGSDSAHAPVEPTGGPQNPRALARAQLLREKSSMLQAIRDVRFEHDLGKVSDADLERLDAQYRVRARALLAELETQIAPYRPKARALLGVSADGANVIEAAGTAEQAAAPSAPAEPVAEQTPDEPEKEKATRACAACSTINDTDAVFCKKCGARMSSEEAS